MAESEYIKLISAASRRKAAAAYLRHALHVQLNEVSLVVLQDGQAHTEDNLQALQMRHIFLLRVLSLNNIVYTTKYMLRHLKTQSKCFLPHT